MRVLVVLLILAASPPAMAQEWTEYRNIPDGFRINFPGQPTVAGTTWLSEYEYTLPARVYSAARGAERYSVTVVDYAPIAGQGIDRRRRCPAGAEVCICSDLGGEGHWKHDTRGARSAFAVRNRNDEPGTEPEHEPRSKKVEARTTFYVRTTFYGPLL